MIVANEDLAFATDLLRAFALHNHRYYNHYHASFMALTSTLSMV